MIYTCGLCGETYDDEWLLVAHQEILHDPRFERPTIIQYAPATFEGITAPPTKEENDDAGPSVSGNGEVVRRKNEGQPEITAEAFDGKVVRHYKIANRNKVALNEFITSVKKVIIKLLKKELIRLNFVKFGVVLDSTFTNVQNEITPRGFITKNHVIMQTSSLEHILEECIEELLTKITEHEGRGSGWSLLSVLAIDVRVHKHGYGDRGSSYIPLPKKIQSTKACVNVKNEDNECFKYAMLCKFLNGNPNANIPREHYRQFYNRYNFNCITYPVALVDIQQFERNNRGVSVNVYGIDDSSNIYPLKVVTTELRDHTDLLLIKKGGVSHYVYIANFNKLVCKQVTKHSHPITVCKRCFGFTNKSFMQGGYNWLIEHIRFCNKIKPVRTIYPQGEKSIVRFQNICHQYRIPIVIYADFEASLLPVEPCEGPVVSRVKYQSHEPNTYCLLVKSTLSIDHLTRCGIPTTKLLYRGHEAAKKLMDDLYDIALKVETLYNCIVPMKNMSDEDIVKHNSAPTCYLCSCTFTEENCKVRDHDHLTGEYSGPACNSCNLNFKLPKFIPVVFHNLSGYDSHFIIPELARDDGGIDVLATTTEKFISFSKKINKIKLRFLDSYRFMPSSLMTLSSNLRKSDLIETKKLVPDSKFHLALRKGVFCYDYIDSHARFEETQLPPREAFYSKLSESEVSEVDYQHACNVWKELGMKTLGEYNDFYVSLDVTLLCDVMEEFRNTCMDAYGLDPFHSFTSPGLAWQAMLKETKCKLELLTDIDMIHMVESGIRGGLTQVVTKHVKANNKYLPDYNRSEQSVYLGYFDSNNLYGLAMVKPLPYGDFQWVNPDSLGDIIKIPQEGNIGYILDCDFEYPELVHDFHYDLPLLPLTEIPPAGKHKKLMATLTDKTRYISHFWTVQQALKLGLHISKIHRVLQFSQSCWLKPYILSNTTRRAAATSAFQKDFYKLMNNSIFGKTLQNNRKHKDLKLVTNQEKLVKLVQKPNFQTSIIINENLVAVSMEKTVVKMDRPLYIGLCILDISKVHMYDFHYNKMVSYYGRDRIGISYMDTDAYIYWIQTEDLYEDLRTFPHRNDFDFSDYPQHHPTYDNGVNKKVLGKFKDETNGVPPMEMVGLMSKMYALKVHEENEGGVIKKAKGVKSMYVKKNLKFEQYKTCLFENQTYKAKFNTIRSFNHKLFSITETKTSLTSHDDKRVTLEDGIHTLPYGHYSLQTIDE